MVKRIIEDGHPINPKHRTSYPPHRTLNKLTCFPHLPANPHKHETQLELLKTLGLQIIEENSSLFDITIYTDGSQIETGLSGSGIAIYKDKILEKIFHFHPRNLSVYKSELSAIDTALKNININSSSKIIIYSDSRAAIYTLQSCFSSKESLLKSIVQSAKAGTLGLPEARESTTQLDERDLLRTIKTHCLQEWKSNAAHDWYRAGGTSTNSVLPREQQTLISRLKSGHLQTMTFKNCYKNISVPLTKLVLTECAVPCRDEDVDPATVYTVESVHTKSFQCKKLKLKYGDGCSRTCNLSVHLHLRWNLYERKDSTASHYPDNHETFRESFGALVNPIIRDLIASFDVTDLPDSIAIRHIHPCFVQCCSIFRSGTGQVFLVELPGIRCTVFHVERDRCGVRAHSNVNVGTPVRVISKFVAGHADITDDAGYLLVYPDILLSTTVLSYACSCPRRAFFMEKFPGMLTPNTFMLKGTVVHEVFQKTTGDIKDFLLSFVHELHQAMELSPLFQSRWWLHYALKWDQDRDTLRKTYLALIRPIFEYAQPMWQTASKTNLNKIDQIQSSAARIICGLRNTCPTKIAEIEANLLLLTHRRKIGLADYIYKRVNAPKSLRTGEFIRKWKPKTRLKRLSPMHLAYRELLPNSTRNRNAQNQMHHIKKDQKFPTTWILSKNAPKGQTTPDYSGASLWRGLKKQTETIQIYRVYQSNREFENRAAIIVALRAGRSPKEIVDFLKLPKTTIYRVKKQFDEADSNKEGIATRKKHSRRSDRVRGEEFVKNVKEKIDGNPGKSMRAIAKEMDVGSMTIVRTIHEDLGLKSYALRKGQLLTENMKNNRKGKAAALLNNLKHDSFGMLRFFSDEKNFDVDQKVNPRNDRWICKDPSEIPVVMHTKFPASVMVLGVISSEGDVMPPHFFEKGLRMNADTYINVLETVVKPWMDMVAAGRKYVFQQDSAPAHKAKKTQSWLTLNVPSHWGPDIWPPNSPDCNPLDYYVWGVVERDVNEAPHTTIQSVKKAVHTVMTQMDKVIVAKACASFRTRLETVNLSVFRSELTAILQALKLIEKYETKNIIIYTDSKAAIFEIKNCYYSQDRLLKNIAAEINKLNKNTKISLQWIPSHVGVSGNEETDRLAKEGAAGHPDVVNSETYLSARDHINKLKLQLIRNHRDSFHHSWYQVENPKKQTLQLNRRESTQLARWKSGHLHPLVYKEGAKSFPIRLEQVLGPGNVLAYADDIVLLIHSEEQFGVVTSILKNFRYRGEFHQEHRSRGWIIDSGLVWSQATQDKLRSKEEVKAVLDEVLRKESHVKAMCTLNLSKSQLVSDTAEYIDHIVNWLQTYIHRNKPADFHVKKVNDIEDTVWCKTYGIKGKVDLTLTAEIREANKLVEKVFWIVFDFYLLKKTDQRTCIKFCVKNKIKCADAFRMLTVAYGEATLDRSNVYRWYKMFSEGREDVNDEERAGCPSTSTTDEKINEVEKMILANHRITIREVAEDLNISIGSCHSIFINNLGMRRVTAKFVPKLLNCDQKQHRMNIANEMLDSVRDDPNLLQRVITGDEAWVYGYDVETKAQSSQWKLPHEPRPKKARQVLSNVKVLLTVFFDCRGVVHHEFLPQGRTVNEEYYLQVMRNLREAIRQKRPDLWKNKIWLLHHDNAPAHTLLLVRDFLAKNNTLMMPQPPYSSELAPCDFFLFPKLKRPMKGRRYATLDEIKTASKKELKKISKNDFLKCFEDWKNRWHKCIISHGDYFEGDKIGIHE
ncbi:hypothetical protein LAZ67_15001667 [Cordylochernes scorpioides]|uniref:RNase H type-1 domain-containing protein n=1 Tax=Cordylochernes scorpioides TaxID=51811 RepID=A0ABY6L8Y3_9ARAC|nr:hypothetical protein LAZ67_15001667 [Cordylochernes scorpioides]